jgi:hypothetical protein
MKRVVADAQFREYSGFTNGMAPSSKERGRGSLLHSHTRIRASTSRRYFAGNVSRNGLGRIAGTSIPTAPDIDRNRAFRRELEPSAVQLRRRSSLRDGAPHQGEKIGTPKNLHYEPLLQRRTRRRDFLGPKQECSLISCSNDAPRFRAGSTDHRTAARRDCRPLAVGFLVWLAMSLSPFPPVSEIRCQEPLRDRGSYCTSFSTEGDSSWGSRGSSSLWWMSTATQSAEFRHPYYWAAFELHGDWR